MAITTHSFVLSSVAATVKGSILKLRTIAAMRTRRMIEGTIGSLAARGHRRKSALLLNFSALARMPTPATTAIASLVSFHFTLILDYQKYKNYLQ